MKTTNKFNIFILSLVSVTLFFNLKVSAEDQGSTDILNNSQLPSVTSSVTPRVTPVKQYKTDKIQEQNRIRNQELKPTIEAKKNQMSAQVLTNMLNMLNTRVNNAVSRLTNRFDLLTGIMNQVETRILTLEKNKNLDLSSSKKYIDLARVELKNSEVLINNISINKNITTREELKSEISSLKSQIDVAHQSLKKVLDLLKQATSSAKELSTKNTKNQQNNNQ